MKVNGFQIKEAMRKWIVEKDVASKVFKSSLFAFDGEDKLTPKEAAHKFKTADYMVAKLEELQQLYNLNVTMEVQGKLFTLALAVKLIGGAGRLEKMWRSATTDDGSDRYSSRTTERSKDNEYAKRMINVADSMQSAKDEAKRASAIRAAISQGNMTEITLGEGVFNGFRPEIMGD